MQDAIETGLLGPDDPPPVKQLEAESPLPLLLVCEHAGRGIPQRLGDLGLASGELDRHIGWDIGAAAVAEEISRRLSAPLILQHYSRLVIDCNRPTQVPSSIPEVSDGTLVPGNRNLSDQARHARVAEIFTPFAEAVRAALDSRPRRLLATIHSYTPVLQGVARPWEIGLLFNRDDRAARRLLPLLTAARPGLVAALNEPYAVSDDSDYTIPVHGEARGIAHVLIEVRNDLIATPEGARTWAALLSDGLAALLNQELPSLA
ncbi:MAG: N-formylglutamate amidohydrolase [Rhodospirillales bacterium]